MIINYKIIIGAKVWDHECFYDIIWKSNKNGKSKTYQTSILFDYRVSFPTLTKLLITKPKTSNLFPFLLIYMRNTSTSVKEHEL